MLSKPVSTFKEFLEALSVVLILVPKTSVAGVVSSIILRAGPGVAELFKNVFEKQSFKKLNIAQPLPAQIIEHFLRNPLLKEKFREPLMRSDLKTLRPAYLALIYMVDGNELYKFFGGLLPELFSVRRADHNREVLTKNLEQDLIDIILVQGKMTDSILRDTVFDLGSQIVALNSTNIFGPAPTGQIRTWAKDNWPNDQIKAQWEAMDIGL